jgi:hypothetical protein
MITSGIIEPSVRDDAEYVERDAADRVGKVGRRDGADAITSGRHRTMAPFLSGTDEERERDVIARPILS